MADMATIERLELRLSQLVDGMLRRKSEQMDFLIGLNRLDDILLENQQGHPINDSVMQFMSDYRSWRKPDALNAGQRKRLGGFLVDLQQSLLDKNDADGAKLADEVKDWLLGLGDGSFRLTLKRPKEQVSLIEKYRMITARETEELDMLLSRYDHLLTCLNDILKSAESKTDPMYRHLAASIIYFLQLEGYKVDPYVQRLRRIKAET